MVTVPRYDGLRVQPTPVPDLVPRVSAPLEAFGGGRAAEGTIRAAQGLIGDAQRFVFEEKRRADQASLLDADTRMRALKLKLLTDPKEGVFTTRKLRDAQGAPEEYMEKFDKAVSKIQEEIISNPAQMAAFQERLALHRGDLQEDLVRYSMSEGRKYAELSTVSGVQVAQEEATLWFLDGARVRGLVEEQKAMLEDFGEANDEPEDVTRLKVLSSTSRTHSLVINRLLAAGMHEEAQARFNDGFDRGEIAAQDADSLLKAIEEVGRRGDAQKIVGDIFRPVVMKRLEAVPGRPEVPAPGEPPKSLADARAQGRAATEGRPDLRDDVDARILREWGIQETERKQAEDDLFDSALKTVIENPEVHPRDAVGADVWISLSGRDQKSLLSVHNPPDRNDDGAWLEFFFLSPEEKAELRPTDFRDKYWRNFDGSHRSRAETMLNDARKADADPSLRRSIVLEQQDLLDLLKDLKGFNKAGMGKDDTIETVANDPEKAKAFRELMEEYRLELEAEQGDKKKVLTGPKKDTIRAGVLRGETKVIAAGREQRFRRVTPEKARGGIEVPVGNIPPKDREFYAALLLERGKRVTDEILSRLHRAMLRSAGLTPDERLREFEEILSEQDVPVPPPTLWGVLNEALSPLGTKLP